MDKLSQLLKETKSLYKARKRRMLIAKSILGVILPMIFFTFFINLYLEGDTIYALLEYDKQYQTQILEDDFGLLRLNWKILYRNIIIKLSK